MKRYGLSSQLLTESFIKCFNGNNEGYYLATIGGITIKNSDEYEFTSVIEHYSFDKETTRENLEQINKEIFFSIKIAEKLRLPFYLILITKRHEFRIYSTFLDINNSCNNYVYEFNENDFIEFFKKIKGTLQKKPAYKSDFFQITEILKNHNLVWGGDVDGVIFDRENNIKGIIEIRKSTCKEILNYNPAEYFLGTHSRAGDYNTWKPLFMLKDKLRTSLNLITLSEVDKTKFGFSQVIDMNNSFLSLKNNPSKLVNEVSDNFLRIKELIDF